MIEIPNSLELYKVDFYIEPSGDDWYISLTYVGIEADRESNSKNRLLTVQTQHPPQEAVNLLKDNIENSDAKENDIKILQILKGYELI